jgi:hypothetical protein
LVISGLPRLGLFLLWVFTDRLTIAFDSFILGFLGFLLLPYTTVFYALAYAPIGGVEGFGWFFVALGFILDIGSYTGGGAARRRRVEA